MNTKSPRWYTVGYSDDPQEADRMGAAYAAKHGVSYRVKRWKDRYAPAPTFIVEVDENPAKGVKR